MQFQEFCHAAYWFGKAINQNLERKLLGLQPSLNFLDLQNPFIKALLSMVFGSDPCSPLPFTHLANLLTDSFQIVN